MKNKIYRSIIIGVGKGGDGKAGAHSIGYAHADAYRRNPRTQLVGGCDLSAENLAKFSTIYELEATSQNLDDLLKKTQPDIVSLCTYVGARRAVLEQCLAAGVKIIWCEKPLALTMEDARAMETAAERAGAKIVVNHLRRYHPGFQVARKLIQEGAIGQLSMMTASIGGWDLMEWGTHWLDMMRFLNGDQAVTWVMGQARCTPEKKGYGHVMEQHAISYFSFENGARGFLDGGCGIPGSSSIRAIGSAGYLDIAEEKLTLVDKEGLREVKLPAAPEGKSAWENSWNCVIEDLLNWAEGGPESTLSLRNGVLSTELYLAAYESAKQGDQIDLPLLGQREFPLDEVARRQGRP